MKVVSLTANEVAAGGHCRAVEECYHPAARRLVGRVVRDFLDQMVLTPTELMADVPTQQKLSETGQHMQRAVQLLSGAQARSFNLDLHKRMREVFVLSDKAAGRLGKMVEMIADLSIQTESITPIRQEIEQRFGTPNLEMGLCVLLSQYLADLGSWQEKMEKLLQLCDVQVSPDDVALIEAVIAEILDGNQGVKALFGNEADKLGDRLREISAMYKGHFPPPHMENPQPVALQLNNLMLRFPMENVRHVLTQQILRSLQGGAPVRTFQGLGELTELTELNKLLRDDAGILIGEEETESLLQERMSRQVSHDNLALLLTDQETLLDKISALITLQTKLIGSGNIRQVSEYIKFQFERRDFAEELLSFGDTPMQKMMVVSKLYKAINGSALADSLKERLGVQLEDIQMSFLKQNKVFAKINKQSKNTAEAVMKLIDLCRSGLFTGGKNLLYVHSLIKHQVNQRNFMAQYLSGIDNSDMKAKKLALLCQKLKEAGIQEIPGWLRAAMSGG